jgi:transposase
VYNTNLARSEGNKTDKIDCKKLAYFVLMGGTKDDLPTVYVPEEKVRQLRGLISTYQLYKKIKTQLKNRIHSILKQNGICVNRKELDKKGFEERMEQFDVSECWKVQLRSVFRELRYTDKRQGGIKEMIYLHGSSRK